MITEWFVQLGLGFASMVAGWLPDDDWSDGFVLNATNALSSFMTGAAQLGNWFPWGAFALCLTGTLGAYFLLFAVKISRQILAHLPLVGGSG